MLNLLLLLLFIFVLPFVIIMIALSRPPKKYRPKFIFQDPIKIEYEEVKED